ncbi:MAG: VacJ family lipoprotein [Rariglobus sp.]
MNPRHLFLISGLISFTVPVFAQKAPAETDPEVVDGADEYAVVQVSDPLEPFNRAMFTFNDHAYDYVLRPVAKGYEKVTPKPVHRGIRNFFDNIKFPIRFVSSALQGKFKRAGQETGKFVVNTVGGLGGFMRMSDEIPALAQVPREDVGQTFGVWGIGKGPYLVLPLLGPGTVRDTAGAVGDYFLNPLHWNLRKNVEWYSWQTEVGVSVIDGVSALPGTFEAYDLSRKDALDPYIAVRSSYVQYREAAVKQ